MAEISNAIGKTILEIKTFEASMTAMHPSSFVIRFHDDTFLYINAMLYHLACGPLAYQKAEFHNLSNAPGISELFRAGIVTKAEFEKEIRRQQYLALKKEFEQE